MKGRMAMRRAFLGLLGAAILALPIVTAAQDTKTATGTITAIGPKTITVKVAGKEMTFNVDEKTDVTARGGSTAAREAREAGKAGPALSDLLKVGQNIEVRYHEQGMHADRIRTVASVPSGAEATSGPPRPQSMVARGVVSAVTGNSVTLKTGDGESTFAIDEKTDVVGRGLSTKTAEIKRSGEKPAITDFIKTGDTIEVTYRDSDGKKLASAIRVVSK
jgi:hypothetical protein